MRTFARFVPERLDDFAWENDRIAFRMYGPALQKLDGNKTGSGMDVWCKHVRQPVINSMYARKNYHNDDGHAADTYRPGQIVAAVAQPSGRTANSVNRAVSRRGNSLPKARSAPSLN